MNVALLPGSFVQEARECMDKNKTEDDADAKDFGLKILMASVVDDKGKPVFETGESFDSLPPAVQAEIMDAVWDYNGLSKASVEDMEKN